MAPPNATSRAATLRERARAELSREIKEEARRQLAASGADGLSLRAVAKELGMVSSALYRYYPSRDDLLTVLIIDAYDAVGAAAEGAVAAGQAAAGPSVPARARWIAACHAVRDWARGQPARVRADLRLARARVPRARGDHRAGGPGPARVRRPPRRGARPRRARRAAGAGRAGRPASCR